MRAVLQRVLLGDVEAGAAQAVVRRVARDVQLDGVPRDAQVLESDAIPEQPLRLMRERAGAIVADQMQV